MAKFKFKFERDYAIREGCERIIEADTLALATAAAEDIARSFNHDCPDDVSELGDAGEASDFEVECISAEVHRCSDPDYRVDADGNHEPADI